MTATWLDEVSSVVVTIPGVRSHGEWGDQLYAAMQSDPRYRTVAWEPLNYPFTLAVIGWGINWAPWCRHWLTDWCQRELWRIQQRYQGKPLDIVCHSYGTWLAWHSIRRSMLSIMPVQIHTLVMVGSVIHCDDPCEAVSEGYIKRIINCWSSNDEVVRFAPEPFGHAGSVGLQTKIETVKNSEDLRLGHGGYWEQPSFYQRVLNELAV